MMHDQKAQRAVNLRLAYDADRDGAPADAPSSAYVSRCVRVGGFDTIIATRRDLTARMIEDCLTARAQPQTPPRLVFSSNGRSIALAARNPAFAAAMAQADIIHAEATPVVQASRLLTRTPLPERIATWDFFQDAARAARNFRLRFYLVGGEPAKTEAACAAAEAAYPGLSVTGAYADGVAEDDADALCAHILHAKADVVWVALGAPAQEIWAVAQRGRLSGVGWIKTGGDLCGLLGGERPVQPDWTQTAAQEWAQKAIATPSRMAARAIATNALAFWRLATMTGDRRVS